jgi:chitinase
MRLSSALTALLVLLGALVNLGVTATAGSAAEARVIAPYYAGWEQANLRPADLPWDSMTHVIHFSVLPTSTGGLNDTTNVVTATNASALIQEARSRGKKVLISVGGTPGSEHWPSAASPTNRSRFVQNLVNHMATRGYDGIDLNWEGTVNEADYLAVMRDLRAALNARGRGELLTAVYFGSWRSLAANSHPLLDWVSMMTYLPYGQSSDSHNSPLYGTQYARIDNLVGQWLAAGVPANKIVIGLATYASEWVGGKLVTPEMPYRTAVAKGYTTNLAWDATARASAWRSSTTFVSVEDDRAVREKADYLKAKGLRGVIVWELGAGRHNGTVPVMNSIRTHLPLTAATTTPSPTSAPAPAPTSAPEPAPDTSTTPMITASQVTASASGTTASGSYVLTTDRSVTFQRVVLAVRNSSGQLFDFAGFDNVTLNGSRTFTGSRTDLPGGTYSARVAHKIDGSWQQIGATVTFTVVASEPTVTLTASKTVYRRAWRSTVTVIGALPDGTEVQLSYLSTFGASGTRSCVMSSGSCTAGWVQLPTADPSVTYRGPSGTVLTVTR